MARHSGGDFGSYMGVPLTGTYVDILDKKLKAEFKPYHTLGEKVNYVRVLELLAAMYNADEWGDAEQAALESARQLAAADKDHLKGDFIMSIFVLQGHLRRHTIKGTGRRLGLNDRQIESVLRHHADRSAGRLTQKAFCELTGITKTAYNRVIKRGYTNTADVKRVDDIAVRLGL
jgi:hypothetical protein